MDPRSVDDQNNSPRNDRNEDETFVPGPLDEPSEANDDKESSIDDPLDDEDKDIEDGID